MPQQSVLPKNKEAYTAAPLENLKHKADAFNPRDDEDRYVVVPASVVVPADHDHGRGDGGSLGSTSVGGGASGVAGLVEQTSN